MFDRDEQVPLSALAEAGPAEPGEATQASTTYPRHELALPQSIATLVTNDLGEIRSEMTRAISHHFVEPERGVRQIAATKASGSLGSFGLIQVGYGADVSIRADSCGPNFLIKMPLSGQALIKTPKGQVIGDTHTATIVRPDDPLHFRFSEDLRLLLLKVPAERLESYCAQLVSGSDHQLDQPLDFLSDFSLESEAGKGWLRMMRYIRDEAVAGSTSLLGRSPIAMASFEQTVLHMILTMQPNNYTHRLFGDTRSTAPSYIRRAEEFMRAHAAEPITLHSIASAAGISVRALSRGFNEFRQTSPIQWLKDLRLDGARKALLGADPATLSVSEIALEWGFEHLGHFGQDYRRRFGETPRETLRRFR